MTFFHFVSVYLLNPETGFLEEVSAAASPQSSHPSKNLNLSLATNDLDEPDPFSQGPRRTSTTRQTDNQMMRHVRLHSKMTSYKLDDIVDVDDCDRHIDLYAGDGDDSERDVCYVPTSAEKKDTKDSDSDCSVEIGEEFEDFPKISRKLFHKGKPTKKRAHFSKFSKFNLSVIIHAYQ